MSRDQKENIDEDLIDFEEDVDECLAGMERHMIELENDFIFQETTRLEKDRQYSLDMVQSYANELVTMVWNGNFAMLQEVSYFLDILARSLKLNIAEGLFVFAAEMFFNACTGIREYLKKEIYGETLDSNVMLFSKLDSGFVIQLNFLIDELGYDKSDMTKEEIEFLLNKNLLLLVDSEKDKSDLESLLTMEGFEVHLFNCNTDDLIDKADEVDPFLCLADSEMLNKNWEALHNDLLDSNLMFLIIDNPAEPFPAHLLGTLLAGVLRKPYNIITLIDEINRTKARLNSQINVFL